MDDSGYKLRILSDKGEELVGFDQKVSGNSVPPDDYQFRVIRVNEITPPVSKIHQGKNCEQPVWFIANIKVAVERLILKPVQ